MSEMKTVEEPMYISPLSDFGFKRIFGDKEIMIAFLMDLLQPKSPIEDVIFLDKEMSPEHEIFKGVIYDLRCKTKDGEEFIVEMQNKFQENFPDRILYYLSRSISSQGIKGDNLWNYRIEPVYGIFFLNFHLRGFEPMPIRTIQFKVEETNQLFSDKVRAYILEFPEFRNKSEDYPKNRIEYWLYNLVNMETMSRPLPFQAQQPVFGKVEDIARMAHLTEEERIKYNVSIDMIRTHLCVMRNERKEGLAEGMMIGEKRGEKKKAILIAQNMKKKGLPIDVIIECTNLSKEDIDKLD